MRNDVSRALLFGQKRAVSLTVRGMFVDGRKRKRTREEASYKQAVDDDKT